MIFGWRVGSRRKPGSKDGGPPAFDPGRHRRRHAVERGVNRLERDRAAATGFGELAVR
ncbi:hypothetical protein [Streptosporangium sp. 'caverna']|uniref:hypothetical protein n=1 Tax=Streptosporangium sp. 'caverna' TaxID=2202249 RepID=UPI0013A6C135|nr:hypothetical protein [Streptosporangium sp. 'caverna']